jgi:hypothetical protein
LLFLVAVYFGKISFVVFLMACLVFVGGPPLICSFGWLVVFRIGLLWSVGMVVPFSLLIFLSRVGVKPLGFSP